MAGTGLVVVGASNSTVVGGGRGAGGGGRGAGGGVINDNKLTVCPLGSCGGLD